MLYGRNGEVEHGVVMLRTEGNARALARVPAHDGATLAHLQNMDLTPVGSSGDIVTADDGVLEWRVGLKRSSPYPLLSCFSDTFAGLPLAPATRTWSPSAMPSGGATMTRSSA